MILSNIKIIHFSKINFFPVKKWGLKTKHKYLEVLPKKLKSVSKGNNKSKSFLSSNQIKLRSHTIKAFELV